MSRDLVTFEDAISHLNLEGDIDSSGDPGLELKITAASRMVLNHLKDGAAAFTDSNGDVLEDSSGPVVPEEVKLATLYLVGILWRKRDEDESGEFAGGRLPAPVRAILGPLRDPAVR